MFWYFNNLKAFLKSSPFWHFFLSKTLCLFFLWWNSFLYIIEKNINLRFRQLNVFFYITPIAIAKTLCVCQSLVHMCLEILLFTAPQHLSDLNVVRRSARMCGLDALFHVDYSRSFQSMGSLRRIWSKCLLLKHHLYRWMFGLPVTPQ